MGEKETVDSITMMDVTTPFVIVLEPSTQNYFLPVGKMSEMTLDTFEAFLVDIRDGKSPVSADFK